MKKYLFLSLTLAVLSTSAFAFDEDECDPTEQDCNENETVEDANEDIYPYKPFETSYIKGRLEALNEGPGFIWSIYDLNRRGLYIANTKVQPWGGPYWPLNQGMVANTYQNKDYKTFIFTLREIFSWRKNVNDYYGRAQFFHPEVDDLDEHALAKLAPSEKYDLLLGDKSFDLTNRIWAYAEKWGEEKKWGFVSKVELPDGYRLPYANRMMALWEGICHGWAVAAGHTPRPRQTVTVTLPNGKRMPFYPDDIKALVSLMWAHSNIQGDVIFEGSRCNKKKPTRDVTGRYIDTSIDKNDTKLTPRCADVHPAIFHVAILNILGIEKRSFIIDKKPEAAIANQPVSGYSFTYFDPKTGKEGSFDKSVWDMKEYENVDWYWESRNKAATKIVGVKMKVNYINWEYPSKAKENSEKDDKIKHVEFYYDLEIDAEGKIIGGQWRADKKVKKMFNRKPHNPDFFWVVPRNFNKYFQPVSGLPEWKETGYRTINAAPTQYQNAAKISHSFVYEESARYFGVSPKCPVISETTGEQIMVDCEFRYPRPQPLIQVVNKLLELSSRQ